MLRVTFGLAVVCVLALLVYRQYFGAPSPEAAARAAREGVVLPAGKNAQEIADGMKKELRRLEDQNRAAIDKITRAATP